MTIIKNVHPAERQTATKRGILRTAAMAAASLCLFAALTGCASTAAGITGADRVTVSQSTAPGDKGTGTLSQSSSLPEKGTVPTPPSAEAGPTSNSTLSCNYYIEKDFLASIEAAGHKGDNGTGSDTDPGGRDAAGISGIEPAGPGGRIAGGITPHHLLAAKMIAGFFRELSDNPPKTIVVIGPNHKRRGFGGLQTSSSDWGTPFGKLKSDCDTVKKLVKEFGAAENDTVMQDEHSISGLVPYIKYYMPDVSIVPILLHGNYSSADSLKLGNFLGKIAAEDPGSVAIIASVDFSHYLDAKTAYKMDDITLEAIKSKDIQAISRMSNDNMDSPPSIITLLGAMDEAGAAGPETTGHSNSSDISGSGFDNTTSYFTMFFRYNDK